MADPEGNDEISTAAAVASLSKKAKSGNLKFTIGGTELEVNASSFTVKEVSNGIEIKFYFKLTKRGQFHLLLNICDIVIHTQRGIKRFRPTTFKLVLRIGSCTHV